MTTEATIKKLLEQQYPKYLNGGDIDSYVALYGDDVVWAVPNLPDATSPGQIGALLAKILSKVTQTVEVTVDDLTVEGDLAIATAVATGTAARKPDGEAQPLALRVMWVLRQIDDDWKITRQVGTPKPTSLPRTPRELTTDPWAPATMPSPTGPDPAEEVQHQ